MNSILGGLFGAFSNRRSARRGRWGTGRSWRRSAPRRRSARRGGLVGSALVAGAAWYLARRRRANAGLGASSFSSSEAVPQL